MIQTSQNQPQAASDAPPQQANEISTRATRPQPMPKWRLHVLVLGLCLSLMLSTLETTIISTTLVSITDALHGFSQRDWIVTSYLLTYTGFLTIYAKFSDIFGRKFLMLLALLLFILFSILCGASSSTVGLIILRAFQGIGGSGIYSMVMVITPQIVPRSELGKYMAIISSVFALSSILGPVIGGAITSHPKEWRWVFLLNAPAGAVAILILAIFLPSSSTDTKFISRIRARFSQASWKRVDFVGAFLLLTASVLLVFALEEAGSRYPWDSAAILSTLIIAGICWIAFPFWEHHVEASTKSNQEPVFPMRLLKDRILFGMMVNAFFTGFPFMVIIVNLPQRFQAVNNFSPFRAGIYLLPLLLSSPFASGLCGYLVSKLKIPPFYLIISGAALQLLGICLLGSLDETTPPMKVDSKVLGYEVIVGFGFGTGLSTLLIMTPLVVQEKDMAVAMGAITQIRVLGGTLGLAICSTILNNHLHSELATVLTPQQEHLISESTSNIAKLSPEQQNSVRLAFAHGYTRQLWVMSGFSGLVVLASFLLWERKPRKMEE